MATIRQSIDVKAPAHALYDQLTRFEDYPRFMEEVEAVEQTDDRHLHWTTRMANRPVEWEAEISELEPDRCIAWHNISGPTNAGRIEVQEVGPDSSRATFTLRAEPQQVPGSMAGNHEDEMAQRLQQDLVRLKEFVETHGQADAAADPQQGRGAPRNSPVPTSSYAAGSEGFSGDAEWGVPVTSTSRAADEQRKDSTGSTTAGQPASGTTSGQAASSAASDTAAAVGAHGGTDAAAGARMTGGKAPDIGNTRSAASGGGVAGQSDGAAGPSAAAGAAAAGGTGLGDADMGAGADATRVTPREGTTAPGSVGNPGGSAGKGGGKR